MQAGVRELKAAGATASFSNHQRKRSIVFCRSCHVRGLQPCALPSASQFWIARRKSEGCTDRWAEGGRPFSLLTAASFCEAASRTAPGEAGLSPRGEAGLFGTLRLLSGTGKEP